MAVGTYALTSLSNLKDWIGVTGTADDAVLESAIDRATEIIERYCDRKFKSRTFYEWCEPNASKVMTVENRPITSVNTISYASRQTMIVSSDTSGTDVLATIGNDGDSLRLHKIASNGTTTTVDLSFETYPTTSALVTQINSSISGWSASLQFNAYSRTIYKFGGRGVIDATGTIEHAYDNVSDYRIDYESGEIFIGSDGFGNVWRANYFPRGFRPVYVEYVAGYSTIPADLELTAIEMAADMYRERKQDRTLGGESLGDYNYSRISVAELLSARWEKLQAYKEVR